MLNDLSVGNRLALAFGAMGLVIAGIGAAMSNTLLRFETGARDALALSRADGSAELRRAVEDMHDAVAGSVSDAILVSALALVAALVLGWLISRRIVQASGRLTGAMERLAGGKLDIAVEGIEAGDEFGKMARALAVFRDNAAENERLRADAAARDEALAKERREALMALAGRFQEAVGTIIAGVRDAAAGLENTAKSVSDLADGTAGEATAAAEAASHADRNVQSVGAATEELNASTQEIASQVGRATAVAREAGEAAERTAALVDGLSKASEKIGEVIDLIASIAAQTNLLALNATIEAARAGEAGKGFAVVANEVKALATQTGKATGEISNQIESMREAITETVEAMRRINATVGRIGEANMAISGAVEEQAATTQEIARNLADAVASVGRVAEAISTVSEASAQTGRAIGDVHDRSRGLSSQAKELERQLEAFLSSLRHGG